MNTMEISGIDSAIVNIDLNNLKLNNFNLISVSSFVRMRNIDILNLNINIQGGEVAIDSKNDIDLLWNGKEENVCLAYPYMQLKSYKGCSLSLETDSIK